MALTYIVFKVFFFFFKQMTVCLYSLTLCEGTFRRSKISSPTFLLYTERHVLSQIQKYVKKVGNIKHCPHIFNLSSLVFAG